MRFKVMQRFGRGPETQCGEFKTLEEAKTLLNKKIQNDVAMKLNVIYRLYDFDEMIEEKDTSKIDASQLPREPEAEGSSQGKGSTSGFRPTPLSTSLKAKGLPNSWKDEDENEKK